MTCWWRSMHADSSDRPYGAAGRLFPRLLWVLALAGLVVLAAYTAWFCVRALSHPYQLLYGEGLMLEFARRLAAGEPLYKPLGEFPLGTANYPPLTLLLARLTFPVAGFGYPAGRVWSGLAALGVAILLAAWVWRATGRRMPAAVAALAWAGAPYVYHWAPQFRVDLPGLALSLAGVYLVWRGWSSRAVYLAAPLFVLGLYCKQSYLAAPASAVLALLLYRRYRQALLLAALVLLLGGIAFAALNLSTGGAFWHSLVTANVNLFDPGRLMAQVVSFSRTYSPLLALAGVGLAGAGARARHEKRRSAGSGRDGLVLAYGLLALLTAALAGKAGSWENYFLEPLAAACLTAGLGLAWLRSWPAGRWLAPVLILLQAGLIWHTPSQATGLMRADAAASQVLGPRIASTPGLILSEDAGLLVQTGKPVPYYDFQLSQLARAGRWDQHWELGNLKSGSFSLVVLEEDSRLDVDHYGRFTRAFMSALDYGYRPAGHVGRYQIYEPAPLDRERRTNFEGGLALVGHTLPPAEVLPGQTLAVDAVWQATAPITQTYTSFLHLVDASGQGHAGDDRQAWAGAYPTHRWAQDEMVRVSYTLSLPAGLPPGLYTVRAGWYDASVARLATAQGAGSVPLAVVVVADPGRPQALPPDTLLDGAFENGVHLLGYRLGRETGSLQLELAWATGRPLGSDYAVFVHLRDRNGANQAFGDGPPLDGRWPTSLWPVGYLLTDPHDVPLPPGLPPGDYELVVGLYDPRTTQRVGLTTGGSEVRLETVSLP